MKTLQLLATVSMALVMLFSFVSAAPASSVNDIEKRGTTDYKFYPLRCNSANIHVLNRHAAIYDVWHEMSLTTPQQTRYIWYGEPRKYSEKCAAPGGSCARATIVYFGDKTWGRAGFKLIDFANAMQRVSDECGNRGGSVEIPGDGEDGAVIHLTDNWV